MTVHSVTLKTSGYGGNDMGSGARKPGSGAGATASQLWDLEQVTKFFELHWFIELHEHLLCTFGVLVSV